MIRFAAASSAQSGTDSFAGISAGDWTAIGTIVLAAVAVLALSANVALAVITARATKATQRAAEATERAASATRDQADATRRATEATEQAAIATRDEADATRRAAEATEEAAKATRDGADAALEEAKASRATVDEMRRDRELLYQPYISWKVTGVSRQDGRIEDAGWARVVNFGRGPLIHGLCCLAWRDAVGSPNLATTILFDLSADSDAGPDALPLDRRSGWMAEEDVTGNPVTEDHPVRVAFCKDRLGNFYRFVPYEDPETWREGQGERPRWVEFYLSHFEQLKKQ